jgi:uncharacterized heparinase superfamily protein
MVVSLSNGHFFMADFGEVGKRGLGGHGHNDTFSFELCLCSKSLIIDSGSPIYTGDIDLMLRFASTEYHNTVMIDNQEMAKQLGLWRISDEATPHNVQYHSDKHVDVIQGEHRGYTRLSDPLVHQRRFSFYKDRGHLVCDDLLVCNNLHQVKLFFHFAPGLQVNLENDQVYVSLADRDFAVVRWTLKPKVWLEKTQVSEIFGSLTDTVRLVLEYEIFGISELRFEIMVDHTN